jgi:hypothetical protein
VNSNEVAGRGKSAADGTDKPADPAPGTSTKATIPTQPNVRLPSSDNGQQAVLQTTTNDVRPIPAESQARIERIVAAVLSGRLISSRITLGVASRTPDPLKGAVIKHLLRDMNRQDRGPVAKAPELPSVMFHPTAVEGKVYAFVGV